MRDSTEALGDCRELVLKWTHIADSTKQKADDYLAASLLNLDAKRAAESREKIQTSLAVSNGQKYAEAQRKASHRTIIIILLAAWNVFTGAYIITH